MQDEYYNGFCNSVIWPLFHYVQDVLDTNPLQEQWDAYVRANEAFCEVAKKSFGKKQKRTIKFSIDTGISTLKRSHFLTEH